MRKTIIKRGVVFASVWLMIAAHYQAYAQSKLPQAPVENSTPGEPISRLNSMKPDGSFQNIFATFIEARTAALGPSYTGEFLATNGYARKNPEVIVLNARCKGPGGFSLYRPGPELIASITKLPEPTNDGAYRATIRKFAHETMTYLQGRRFPKGADCDPTPVAIALVNRQVIRLRRDDAGSSLIGGRIDDAEVYEALQLADGSSVPGGLANGFLDAKTAMLAASRIVGEEILIGIGGKVYLYAAGDDLSVKYKIADERIAALAAATPTVGYRLIGMATGYGPTTRFVPLKAR